MIPDFCFSNFCGFGRDAIRHADRLANASLFARCRGIRRIHPNQQIAAYEPARRVSLLLCLCMAHCYRANQNRVTAKRQLQARGLASKPATPAARIIILIILNKIYKLLVENLFFGRQEETQNRPLPISERAKEVMHNHFGEGADFYIGLDPAVLLGDPEVVTAGILFIPITLLIAIIMPGNKILPFGDLATIGFFIAIAVAVHKGNLFRTLISGSAIMAMTIWITNQTVAWTTALGTSVGAIEKGAQLAAMDQGGCPITYIFVQLFTRENIMGLIAIGAMYVVCMFFAVMHSRQRAIEVAGNRDEDDE